MSITEDLLLQISVESAGAREELAGINEQLAATDVEASRAGKSVGGFERAFTSLKALFAGLAIAKAVQDFAKFQSQMERLHTQTGATQGEVGRMSKAILGMAVSVGAGPQSLAQSLYHLESAGFRGKAALDGMRIAAEGAKVGGADLTDTTTSLTAVLVAGFRGVKTLSQAMGILNATVGAGDMTWTDLNDALGTGILATFRAAGLQVQDLGASLAVLGDNNIRGAKAATQLRQAVLGMIGPSKQAQGILKSLGMAPDEMAKDLQKPNGLLIALEALHKSLAGLSKTQQESDVVGIFGRRDAGPVLTLLNQLDRLKTKYADVSKAGGDFGKDWAAATKTLSFFIDQVKALAEVLLIRLGGAINSVFGWIENKLVPAFQHGKVWAQALVIGLSALVGVFLAVRAATVAWGIAMAILEATNPILLLISAIVAGIVLLILHWKQVEKVAVSVWHSITNAARQAWNFLKKAFDHSLANTLIQPFKWLVQALPSLWNAVESSVSTVISTVGRVFKGLLPGLEWPFKQLYNILKGIWDAILSDVRWVVGKISSALSAISGPLNAVASVFSSVFGGGGGSTGTGQKGPSVQTRGTALLYRGGKAAGGPVYQSGSYLVGEEGPEVVQLPRGANVVPSGRAGAAMAGGGTPLEAQITIVNQLDGHVVSRQVMRQGLMATARRGFGGAVLADAG